MRIVPKSLRILGLALVASLMVLIVSATGVSAARGITLSSTNGQLEDEITIHGYEFPSSSTETERMVSILFSSNDVSTTNWKSTVTSYEEVATRMIGYQGEVDAGEFTTTFKVPATLTDGTVNKTVTAGTYFIYAVIYRLTVSTGAVMLEDYVYAKSSFTVTGGEISVTPTSGAVDSAITISGSSFTGNAPISITFGGTPVIIESGSSTTTASGTFTSVIAVPLSRAGIQQIAVTVGSTQKLANFTVSPDILITPQSGKAGDTVLISGTGFGRRVVPTIYFNSLPVEPVSPVITDINGSFSTSIIVPDSQLPAGVYQIEADDSTNTKAVNFTLNATTTPTTPTTPTGPANTADISVVLQGSTAVIIGTSFTPNTAVSILLDDEEIGTATADAEGKIQPTIQLPVVGGTHVLKVTDGSVFDTYTYAVESTPPAVPQPLGPGNESKPKAPITFTWEAVTDESLPVTYHLQVASDEGFAAGDIVLDIEDITSVGYQLTELEQLELAGQAAPYYYRIRAVDAAQNPSTWGPEVAFYVTESAGFPSWAIYTLAGVGGILLFGIGYLVGRRTAFYY